MNKKDEFVKLALMGLASGMLISNAVDALQNDSTASQASSKGGNALASSCKTCNAIANSCKSCNAIANSCKSCNAIASSCKSCNAIAEKDAPKSLTAPAPIPKGDAGKKEYDPNDQNSSYHLMTDEELKLELNDATLKVYEKMSPEAKALTRQVASAMCNGTNECKGLGACKTETHDCAGKNSCKGEGKCAVSDKNLAVKLVEQKMEAKRQNLTK